MKRNGFTPSRRSAEHGFTVVELLVALTIFAVVSAAGVLMLSGSVQAQGAVAAKLDDLAAMQRISSIMTADFAQAVPRVSRTESGTLAPAFFARGAAGDAAAPAVQFVRTGRTSLGDAPRPALQKLEYLVADGRLQRRAYPAVDGAAPSPATTMIAGVADARFRFRGPDGAWRDDWTPTEPLRMPRAGELTLTLAGRAPVRLLFLIGVDPLPERKP